MFKVERCFEIDFKSAIYFNIYVDNIRMSLFSVTILVFSAVSVRPLG